MSRILRDLARDKDCQCRIPGVCINNCHTVVLAHYRMPGDGMGIKPDDFTAGAWCCSACHDAVDGRSHTHWELYDCKFMHLEAVRRTQDEIVKNHISALKKYLESLI